MGRLQASNVEQAESAKLKEESKSPHAPTKSPTVVGYHPIKMEGCSSYI